jgi:hypothetical protein
MTRRTLAILAALACLAAGCGSNESEGSSGEKSEPAKLSAQESSTVKSAIDTVESTCGRGRKTAELDQSTASLIRVYEAKGPDATVEGGGTLDRQMATVQTQLQKCGATDLYARVIGARAAKGRGFE